MDYVMLTLRYEQQEVDLELPTGVPLFNLVPIVMSQLSWKTSHEPQKFAGRIGGMVLRPYETLAQIEAPHGAVMELFPVQGGMLVEPDSTQAVPPSSRAVDSAYLKSRDTDESLPILNRSTLIGRAPGCTISLQHFPNGDVVSSQHANLVLRDDSYWLTDENSTNGTIVDGIYLQSGESVRLRNGSQIQFGETGPVFVFYAAQ
jgi:hypothetical protein